MGDGGGDDPAGAPGALGRAGLGARGARGVAHSVGQGQEIVLAGPGGLKERGQTEFTVLQSREKPSIPLKLSYWNSLKNPEKKTVFLK